MKFLFAVFVLLGIQLQAQPYFQTNLKPGSYSVGFKSGIHYDDGRPPITGQHSHSTGRAVHISVWYPSTPDAGHPAMMFHEYVEELVRMINPDELTKRSREESINQMKVLLSQLGGDTALVNDHLPQLLSTSTNAFRNATILPDSFPIIIYPESPHQNSMLSEYLASNGYIVVSVSRHGTHTTEFEWQNIKGIETLVQDCQFALSVVRKEFTAAGKGLAVMGTGMNASAGLAWMMRNPMIGALVSLEGGILTRYEYELIQRSPYFDKMAVTRPMLVMHSPHEVINPDLIKHYKYADRYMVHLPKMSEYHYLNFGVWENNIPGILGIAPGDTKLGFEWMARYTLAFLDWKLKMNESGKKFFESPLRDNAVPDGLMDITIIDANEVPLTESELLALKVTNGFEAMMKEVERTVNIDTAAFEFEMYGSIGEKLLGAQEYTEAVQWAEIFREIFPASVYGYTMAGRAYLALQQKEKAHDMYFHALNILDADHRIEPNHKQAWRERMVQRLQQLSQ